MAPNSEAFIVLSFEHKLVLIGGTSYAGEIKKSVLPSLTFFSLPERSFHALRGQRGHKRRGCPFFRPLRHGQNYPVGGSPANLIGDDEHGWSNSGIFNFEGGCYAKTIRLSHEAEHRFFLQSAFGTVLENVGFNLDRRWVDFDDASLTENTRAAYPLSHIDNAVQSGLGKPSRTS